MNQPSWTIYNSSLAHLFNELNFQLKFSSFGSSTKFYELIVESSSELLSGWFGSLSALLAIDDRNMIVEWKENETMIIECSYVYYYDMSIWHHLCELCLMIHSYSSEVINICWWWLLMNSYMLLAREFDGVCMYWKMLMLIVDDLLLINVIESYVHAFISRIVYLYWRWSDIYINIGDDSNTTYSYWWWKWYKCILRWRPWWWPLPRAYRVVSRRIV